ncbi:MAG: ATP-binding protein [Methanomassiliicoccaceae archaeon]|nr:ATP-binding protein [Methanomassiliicoccaceae archaeon]
MAIGIVVREDYLRKLSGYKDQTGLVKVITGMRRCGKSTLMRQYRERLLEGGIDEDRVVYIDMSSKANGHLRGEDSFYDHLISRASDSRTYFLLDEIQNVTGWERVVVSLLVDVDADIYITGSNAYMLSTELSTYLTGRSVPISMLPLSFGEFMELNGLSDEGAAFDEYLSIGSMPIVRSDMPKDDALEIVSATRSDIMVKDIARRKKLTDVSALERVIDYLFSEIGNQISGNSISKQMNIDNKTAESYLQVIRESLMFYQVKRFDLKGKMVLTTPSKYYCTDLGMRNASIGEYTRDLGRSVENLVFLELVRRGYRVHAGKLGDTEIDFVADKGGRREYYQVSLTVLDKDVEKRETGSLREMNDGNKRTILTMDRAGLGAYGGIERVNVIDWLLGR